MAYTHKKMAKLELHLFIVQWADGATEHTIDTWEGLWQRISGRDDVRFVRYLGVAGWNE